jgi:molybdate transport system permease protein
MKHASVTSVSNKAILVVLALIVVAYFLFVAVPIIAVVLQLQPNQLNVQLQDSAVIDAIQLSLYTSAVATVTVFVLAVPTAYFMATRKFPGKAIIDTIIDLPIVLPPAVAGVALLYTFAPNGLLGPVLNSLHLTIPGYTVAVVIAESFVASPFLLRSAKTGFENLDKDIINSAKILDSSRLRVFFKVSLPLSLRAITTGMMMSWARAMGEFGATLVFAGNLPGVTTTMPLAIYTLIYSTTPSRGITLSVILIAISFTVLILIKLLEQNRLGGKK